MIFAALAPIGRLPENLTWSKTLDYVHIAPMQVE